MKTFIKKKQIFRTVEGDNNFKNIKGDNSYKNSVIINKKKEYRSLCLELIDYIRQIPLCNIYLNQNFEAVLVEFRILPHIEFIIRNTIHKLGDNWSHTIICGNINYEFMNNVCKEINTNIKIIRLNYENFSQGEYSDLLCTINFWELLKGEKILIYQEDSCIFKTNILDFINWDYIGAPFTKDSNNTSNVVGNGGFSLRTRNIMINVIKTIKLEDTQLDLTTIKYMKSVGLKNCPEDIYFCKNMREYNIGIVSDWNNAFEFSTELVYNPHSLGGHCFWLKDYNWKGRVLNIINENIYIKNKPNSNINLLTRYNKQNLSSIENLIDVDFEFMREIYPQLNIMTENELINYIKQNNFNNHFFHFKQLSNLFQNKIEYLKNIKNNKLIKYGNKLYKLNDFIEIINNYTYENFKNITIQLKYNYHFKSNELIIIVFIGNEQKGIELLNKLIVYSKIQTFSLAFCINYKLINVFKEKILEYNFDSFVIYCCNEFGNDITPSLLVYDEINKIIDFTYVIKLHTKTDNTIFHNFIDYLLDKQIKDLLYYKNNHCNCIGFSYINIKNDYFFNKIRFNVKLLEKYENKFTNFLFVPSTIFFTFKNNFTNVLIFFMENFKTIFLQNTYDNNSININESYVHFMERLFGVF
jgi:hypothetical protein